MDGAEGMDKLRVLAPKWSLAGDEQLLSILQNTHQRIMSKCQEVNERLEEMVTALDDTSISLQNVNNKFMALSNSQFIESRVYDDDVDVITETVPMKEAPKPAPADDLSSLKRSLAVLESLHSPVTILRDSDTESSDDEQRDRLVLKPKDMYADRPLPFIIGSQAWKNKWHAGLLVEDSDTDSMTSKHADRDSEQYSDSEPELGDTANIRTDTLNIPDRTISETSSELPSEQDVLPPAVVKQTPSDIAAELARRLGGHPPKITEQEPEYSPPNPIAKKIYRPEQPTSGTIFSDEPPPIDQYQSDGDYSQEDDDIFAELHKNKPYSHNNIEQSRLADDLFGFNNNAKKNEPTADENRDGNLKGDIYSHFAKEKQKTGLFDDESEPELFASKPLNEPAKHTIESEKSSVKKPVGGISLFGTNKSAESIGAAILNRNRRKSSTSEEESRDDEGPHTTKQRTKSTDEIHTVKKEKDIFDDLFAKSEKTQKKNPEKLEQDKEKKSVKDLFNDNLFDDIDDIFTSSVVKIPVKDAKHNQKSLFSDEDDLFADIAVTEPIKNQTTSNKYNKKSLFGSDDDLFLEKENISKRPTNVVKSHSGIDKTGNVEEKSDSLNNVTTKENDDIRKQIELNKESNSLLGVRKVIETPKVADIKPKDIKSIFDSDSSENDADVFSNINKHKNDKDSNTPVNMAKYPNTSKHNLAIESEVKSPGIKPMNEVLKVIPETKHTFQSPLLFDDEEIDDLFVNTSKLDIQYTNLPQATETDRAIIDTVSNITEDTEAIDNNIVDYANDTKTYNKNIEEYVIPDQIDDTEIFKSGIKGHEDIFYNNGIIAEGIETKLNNCHANIIGDMKGKVGTKIPQSSDHIMFETPNIETQSNLDFMTKSLESEIPEIDNSKIDTNNSVLEKTDRLSEDEGALFSMPVKEKATMIDCFKDEDSTRVVGDNTVFSIPKEAISNEVNIFDDIFSEPPAFEKPKEPKKSKNINALFDDDSDDEALFFKKNDVIADEKPEDYTVNTNQDQFGLFHDEPPAINDEFDPETSTKYDFDDNRTDMPSSVPITKGKFKNEPVIETDNVVSQNNLEIDFSKEDLFGSLTKTIIPIPKNLAETASQNKDKENNSFDNKIQSYSDDLFTSISKPEQGILESNEILTAKGETILTAQQDSSNTKLEQSLLEADNLEKPAVELKKESVETTKIGRINTKNFNINVNALLPGSSPKKIQKDQTDGQIISASYEELSTDKTESKIVKSISFEAEPDSEVLDNKLSKQRARIQIKRRPSSRRARHEAVRKSGIDFVDDSTDNSSSIDDPPKCVGGINKVHSGSNTNTVDSSIEKPRENLENETKVDNQSRQHKGNTTKVVYILNDEDIFNTNQDVIKRNEIKSNVLNVVDDEVDLFKSQNVESNITDGIKTLGKAYSHQEEDTSSKNIKINQKETQAIPKKSIFDDLSDEENQLFNKNRKPVSKVTIFDSDSDEELFAGKSKKERAVVTKKVIKGPLFGDDDVDDLFGAKTNKGSEIPTTSKAKISLSKELTKTEPLGDPLSLLGNDD